MGIARYVRDREDPHAAEIAVTVIDGWQGRGLGTELLAQLSERACQEGIRRFTAAVAADNAAMTGLLRNLGADLVAPGVRHARVRDGTGLRAGPPGAFPRKRAGPVELS